MHHCSVDDLVTLVTRFLTTCIVVVMISFAVKVGSHLWFSLTVNLAAVNGDGSVVKLGMTYGRGVDLDGGDGPLTTTAGGTSL